MGEERRKREQVIYWPSTNHRVLLKHSQREIESGHTEETEKANL